MQKRKAFGDFMNNLNYMRNFEIIFFAHKKCQFAHERLFVQFLDEEHVTLLVFEVVDQPSHHL